jgi:hypothetical protein
MSISSISSQEAGLLYGVTGTQTSAGTSDLAAATTTASAATTSAAPDAGASVKTDLASLLKAVQSGDTAGATSQLATLKSDLKQSQIDGWTAVANAISDSTAANSAKSDVSSLDTFLTDMIGNLNAGRNDTALNDLRTYLVGAGMIKGNAVDTTA